MPLTTTQPDSHNPDCPSGSLRAGRFYHPELDVLRFAAFLCVFAHHLPIPLLQRWLERGIPPSIAVWIGPLQHAGSFGVDLFFTLSSYLITELLIREYHVRRSIDLRAFYIRRCLRIWPLYFFFVLAAIFVIPHFVPFEKLPKQGAQSLFIFCSNWYSAQHGFPQSVTRSLWSVSIEEQFYIVWPVLLLVLGVKRIRHIAFTMIAVAFVARFMMVADQAVHPRIWCNTFCRLDTLALGALVAVTLRGGVPSWSKAKRRLAGLGAIAAWILVSRYAAPDGPTSLIAYPVVAIASATLLLAVLCRSAERPWWAKSRTLIFLGRISYGLYVYHDLCNQLAPWGRHNFLICGAFSLALTILIAVISYKVLEEPFLRLKERFTYVKSRPAEALPAAEIIAG